MKNRFLQKKRLLRLCSLLILIPMLLLSACNKNGDNATQTTTQDPNPPRKVTVGVLFSEINQNKLPALEEPPEEYDPNPGDNTPVEYLKQAPQDIVGEKLQLSFEEMLEGDIFYRYNASKKQLVIIYYRDSNTSLNTQVMLVMRTEYADMKEFLSLSDLWTGTVTAVKIVSWLDVMYSHQSIVVNNNTKATEASAICYGIVTAEKEISAYDSVQPNDEDYGFGFDRAVARFGIE